MAYSGFQPPNNQIVVAGDPTVQELKIETATNCKPGRFVMRGTNDDDIVVCNGLKPPIGLLGYEQAHPSFKPDTRAGLYAANAMAPVLNGDFTAISPGGLAAGTVGKKSEVLVSWSDGLAVPGIILGGRVGIKIPFGKSTTEKKTGVKLPAGVVIRDAIIKVDTAVASSTIDVGTDSGDSGDADGFADGVSCATAGLVMWNDVDGTAANNTRGALLVESDIKTADTTALYLSVGNGYLVPTGGKEVTYTTTDHDVAGEIILFVESPGVIPVGKLEITANAASAAANAVYKCLI
jgi:hypothetical protein